MKILHILDHSIPLHSGYTFRTRAILQAQHDMGWKTFHVTSGKHLGCDMPEETVDGFHFYRTPIANPSWEKVPLLNYVGIIRDLTQRIIEVACVAKPDLLHAHSPALNGMAALNASKKLGIPLVYECRAFWEDAAVDHGTSTEGGLRYRLTRYLESHVFRQADAVTTICEGLRNEIISRGIPAGKVTVIPNAVNVDRFTFLAPADESLRLKLGLQDKRVLGFIGSFYAYEGLPLLLDALPQILKQASDVRLLLVGGGPQEALLKKKVSTLGLDDVVVFTGRVPHNEVQDYYNLVDLFVYPRLPMRLTELVTPLKPLEAMAQGKLVLASNVGGHHELIKDSQNGYLFESGDCDALSEKLLSILGTTDQWDSIRQQGREYVEKERNWQVSVSNYKPVFEGLVQ